MSRSAYRRKAVLTRVRKALDAFYMLQRIDWKYDIGETLARILGLALEEVELEGEKTIERALVIVQTSDGEDLEVKAGWKVDDLDHSFSHTIVERTFEHGDAILCENAKDDPRFMNAESIKQLDTLSLIAVPLPSESGPIGVFYVESDASGNIFNSEDLEFLGEFAEAITPYVKTGLAHQDHVRKIRKLEEEVTDRYSLDNIIGRSKSMRNVFELVQIAADVDRTVLITGESGCGKELVAKAIHHNGHRRDASFVVVDCSSLSEHLLESELFGHVRGSFTGAAHDKVGAFEEANGGTLFLDEINDASKSLQKKLRRVLQEREIKRVGEATVRQIDVRVICATNRDLSKLVKSGDFIHDLYFRVNKFPIHIPPLRERREDIPLLVQFFLDRLAQREERLEPRSVTSQTMALLVTREWRENNIRELRNTVELASDLCSADSIQVEDLNKVYRIQSGQSLDQPSWSTGLLPTEANPSENRLVQVSSPLLRNLFEKERETANGAPRDRMTTPFYRIQLEFEARVIIEALRCTNWKLRPAARLLGISPMKLRGSLKEFLLQAYGRADDDLDRVAENLEIPLDVLERKVKDFGLETTSSDKSVGWRNRTP